MSGGLSTKYLPYSGENGNATDGIKGPPPLTNRQSVHCMVNPDDFEYGEDDRSVDEDLEVDSIASSLEDQLTWRGRMQVAVHSIPLQIFILSLVVLDALIVLFELLLDVGAFNNLLCQGEFLDAQAHFCHYDINERELCHPSPILLNNATNLTEGDGLEFCHCVFRGGLKVCRPHTEGHGVNPALVLHIASILILSTFMAEIIVKLIAFRLKYFTHKFEVFDGLIVVISWVLDIASIVREEGFAQVATLIILLRLWRVVRIINGAILSAKARSDDQLQKARHKVKEVIHALHKAQDKIVTDKEDSEKLIKLLDDNGIPVPDRIRTQHLPVPTYPYDKEEGISFDK